MSSVLKPAYLHAADPADTRAIERYLYADPAVISQSCETSSAFLRFTLAQPALNIRPLSDDTLQDWNNLPDNRDYFMWRHLLSLHPESGNFGFAVYHDDLLCGMALNTFVERPLVNGPVNDVMIEWVEKNSGHNPLSGFVLSALCEASREFASTSHADRLVIFSIDSLSVMKQYPHMGFAPDNRRTANAVLDLREKDGIDWPRFLQHRETRHTPCSQPSPSI